MSIAVLKSGPRKASAPLPRPYSWQVDEFQRAREANVWDGHKVLLIDGELIEMPAAKPPHDISLTLAYRTFSKIFDDTHVVRIQMGMVFNINTDPIPDLAVVPGDPRTMVATPTSAVFVLEVSESSLAFDTREKASLYAAAAIADYWVVDVVNRQVLVHRSPVSDATAKYGSSYSSVTALSPGQSLAPLAAPQRAVDPAEILV